MLSIEFLVDNKIIFSQRINEPLIYFWSKYGKGIWLKKFNVPEQLPLDKEIYCVVKVLVPDQEFWEAYGPVRFFIEKTFEY